MSVAVGCTLHGTLRLETEMEASTRLRTSKTPLMFSSKKKICKPFDKASSKSYIMDEDNAMKQFTTSEAKKLLKDILAEKKQRAEYFKANGTLKGFAPTK